MAKIGIWVLDSFTNFMVAINIKLWCFGIKYNPINVKIENIELSHKSYTLFNSGIMYYVKPGT